MKPQERYSCHMNNADKHPVYAPFSFDVRERKKEGERLDGSIIRLSESLR